MTTMTRQEEIKAIHSKYPRFNFITLGIVVLSIGVLIGFYLVDSNFLEGDYSTGLYTEFISIIITIVVLDQINDYRDAQRRKKALFRQVKSRSNDFAVDALDQILNEDLWDELLEYYRNDDGRFDLSRVQWAGGVNLRNKDLKRVNFSTANLERIILANAKLEGVNLYGTNLKGADLRRANLAYTDLEFAKLNGAYLAEANLQGANLMSANLERAMLGSTNLTGARLALTNMEHTLAWKVNLQGAYLANAKLKGAELRGANLPDGTKWTPETDLKPFTGSHPDFETMLDKIKTIREEMGFPIP